MIISVILDIMFEECKMRCYYRYNNSLLQGIELSKIDYKRYPDEELQKKWIKMYLEEVAILNGMLYY